MLAAEQPRAAPQTGENADVRLVARRKDQALLSAKHRRNTLFKSSQPAVVAAEHLRTRRPHSGLVNGAVRSGTNPRMQMQPKVTVRVEAHEFARLAGRRIAGAACA